MGFRFRLTFHHFRRGYLHFELAEKSFEICEGLTLTLRARDGDTLSEAQRFQIEGRGFASEDAAQLAGERLRLRLRVLNSLLSLGFIVPVVDTTSGLTSTECKEKAQQQGIILHDATFGLAILPDDDMHRELVWDASLELRPSDPSFLFRNLAKVWPIEMTFDERDEDAIEILGRASTETSPRAKFLMTYLAAERIISREKRSAEARSLIREFQEQVGTAGLAEQEANSLKGALAHLNEQSFRSALYALADRIRNPMELQGKGVRKFLSDCVDARNDLAHKSNVDPGVDLQSLSNGLREFVMGFVWTRRQLPSLTIDTPGSAIDMPESNIRII